jgi:hypothetical protein
MTAHVPIGATCATCRWFLPSYSAGACRRHAPRLLQYRDEFGEGPHELKWPDVGSSAWCGEWTLKVEVKP